MNIEEAKELRRKAEADIRSILCDLAGKVQPTRMDVRLEIESFIDSSGTIWEERIASISVRINMEI